MSKCPSGCPNVPEPKGVYRCSDCDEPIVEGEEYAEIDGEYYHVECLEMKSTREILEMFGVGTHPAEVEDGR